jgi:hypothetical protein
VGETVPVLYDPGSPDKYAMIASFSHLWLWPIVATMAGLIVIAITFFVAVRQAAGAILVVSLIPGVGVLCMGISNVIDPIRLTLSGSTAVGWVYQVKDGRPVIAFETLNGKHITFTGGSGGFAQDDPVTVPHMPASRHSIGWTNVDRSTVKYWSRPSVHFASTLDLLHVFPPRDRPVRSYCLCLVDRDPGCSVAGL